MVTAKLYSQAIIPGIVVLILVIASTLILSSFETDYSESLTDQKQDALFDQTIEHARALDSFFSRVESIERTLSDFASELFTQNSPSGRDVYFHDALIDRNTPEPEFSARHQQTVDYSVSTYFVVSDEGPFQTWSNDIQQTINVSADLDLLFSSLYASMDDIFWIYIGFENGVHRSYPWHGPFSDNYDPRQRPWYTQMNDAPEGEIAFTTPISDITTGSLIITATLELVVNSEVLGVIAIDFLLDTIQNTVLSIDLGDDGRAFLINEDYNIIVHPLQAQSNMQESITVYEGEILENIVSVGIETPTQFSSELNDKPRIYTFVRMSTANLILGLSVPSSSVEVEAPSPDVLLPVIILLGLIGVMLYLRFIYEPKPKSSQEYFPNVRESKSQQPTSRPLASTTPCPACGAHQPVDTTFCMFCGSKFGIEKQNEDDVNEKKKRY